MSKLVSVSMSEACWCDESSGYGQGRGMHVKVIFCTCLFIYLFVGWLVCVFVYIFIGQAVMFTNTLGVITMSTHSSQISSLPSMSVSPSTHTNTHTHPCKQAAPCVLNSNEKKKKNSVWFVGLPSHKGGLKADKMQTWGTEGCVDSLYFSIEWEW